MTTSSRVQWVQNLKKDTQRLLKEAALEGKARASEGKARASAVKRWLGESEKKRLEDFGTDFSAIQKDCSRIQKEAQNVLRGVRRFLKTSEKERIENFEKDFSAIQKEVAGIKNDTLKVLKDACDFMKRVAKENGESAKEVRVFLTASEKERLAAFGTMMKGIGTMLADIKAAVRIIQEHERHERMLAATVTTKKHSKMGRRMKKRSK